MGIIFSDPVLKLHMHVLELQILSDQQNECAEEAVARSEESVSLAQACVNKRDNKGARRHATNAVRDRKVAESCRRLEARMRDVIPVIEQQISYSNVSATMTGVTRVLSRLADADDIPRVMGELEGVLGVLESNARRVGRTVDERTDKKTTDAEVDVLIQELEDQCGLEESALDKELYAEMDKHP